ncbi:FirrV-1-A46 [Feldmannia irregularis virus a]|uniref:FirrV-1-A46 n=1 Tax=Feldmannia irregularis virus a TaxID=231992 RepID=Q6XM41_9PHYC|nr:FirrV-1-A46 [Feldmannia irregularis virus a]AAR26870.1 FirrV-1-A46 [Feldmannia irregularis virus a]
MMNMIGIYQFLRAHGCFHNKTIPRTHTIMSGGVLYVPEENYDEFLGVYAREIDSGNRGLTFSELKSGDVFRMYFDIDMLETRELDLSYFVHLCRDMVRAMRQYYTDVEEDTFKCVVCTTKPKKRTQDEYIKNGCHVIFPSLRVNLETALQLRFFIVQALENTRGVRKIGINPWCDIIDKAPYYNGLKMCGSVKTIPCLECKGANRNITHRPEVVEIVRQIRNVRRKYYPRNDNLAFDYSNVFNIEKDEFKHETLAELFARYQEETGYLMCVACGNRGWYLEHDRFYMPAMVLNGDGSSSEGELEYLHDNPHEAMRWTSIRCRPSDEVTGGYTMSPDNVGQYLRYARYEHRGESVRNNTVTCLNKLGPELADMSPGMYREAVNGAIAGNDADVIRTWKGEEITDTDVIEAIQNDVRVIHSNYKQLQVRQVFHLGVGKTVKVNAFGEIARGKRKKVLLMMAGIAEKNKVDMADKQVEQDTMVIVARVSGPGASYCMNKNREHGSNHIYFWITPEGIYQKCFSRKDALGSLPCKAYRSGCYKISRALKLKLFPQSTTDRSEQGGVLKNPRYVEHRRVSTQSNISTGALI